MRTNLPVSHKEYFFPESQLLVSTTHARGHITHCNTAFAEASGYSYDELSIMLKRPTGTIKSWVRRSLQRLRACLEAGLD